MRFRLFAYMAVGFFSLSSGHLLPAQTFGQDTLGITILVYDSARVPPRDLAKANRQAGTIFRAARIAAAFVDCSAGSLAEVCHRPARGTEFVVHIVPNGKTSTDAVFGVAFLGADGSGTYSDIFYDRVEQMHRDSGASLAGLLGTVAAHEIGHLLLGSHSHSATGIMSAQWQHEELRLINMGSLGFIPEQAYRMRARIKENYWKGRGSDVKLATAGGTK